MPAHLGMYHHQIDEIVAVKILGPDQEPGRNTAHKESDKNTLSLG